MPVGRVVSVLSAPLVVTAVGAVLAGFLIPRIAAQTEDHRKARDLQTALVQDMAQAVASVVPTGELLATRGIEKQGVNGGAVFDQALLQWDKDRASIEARLHAYFEHASIRGEALPQAWLAYAQAVENLYYLSTTELPDRCSRARALAAYLAPDSPPPSCKGKGWSPTIWGAACSHAANGWDALALCDEDSLKPAGEGYVRGPTFFNAYTTMSGALLARENVLLDGVRSSAPAGF
jgi:hypothetical protein